MRLATVGPINAYGRSKLKAEELIRDSGCSHVILRSSIIVGPEVPGVHRPLFLQFITRQIQDMMPTKYLVDEVRNPIFALDICRIIQALICSFLEQSRRTDHDADGGDDWVFRHTFNMGGVDRLSRLEMARAVARAMGVDGASIGKLIIPCTSADLARPYRFPTRHLNGFLRRLQSHGRPALVLRGDARENHFLIFNLIFTPAFDALDGFGEPGAGATRVVVSSPSIRVSRSSPPALPHPFAINVLDNLLDGAVLHLPPNLSSALYVQFVPAIRGQVVSRT
jgi:hypothetical protein